jgi:hypothetical protein
MGKSELCLSGEKALGEFLRQLVPREEARFLLFVSTLFHNWAFAFISPSERDVHFFGIN